MTRRLNKRFLLSYILIGISGFFLIWISGFFLIEKHLQKSIENSFLEDTALFLENEDFIKKYTRQDYDSLILPLKIAAQSDHIILLLLDSEGKVILSSEHNAPLHPPVSLHCTSRELLEASGHTGTFFHYFARDYLHMVTPLNIENHTQGYLSLHYQTEALYQKKSNLLFILTMLFLLFYGFSLLLLIIYRIFIHNPMKKITDGAAEYSRGNLTHRIPIYSDDEMGYLAHTLNYMADRINQNSEYQRNFISNISHDFRSPLTSIKGFAEAMLDGTIPPEQQEKYLKIISYETERLEKLTRSLLTLNEMDTKKRSLQKQCFDINELIRTITATFETRCRERNILLTLKISSASLYAFADMEQIQQVVYNLLDNAIKFSPDHSSVIIETKAKNEKIFVSVKDYGDGIPKTVLPHIWERFYKTNASRGKNRGGTGLGLAIVKEIIRAHDQNINVVSTLGAGTEFIFSLERAKK